MTDTPNPVRLAIYEALSGDSDLTALASGGIFFRVADEGSAPPYVVFARTSQVPAWALQGGPVENELWTVRATSENAAKAEMMAAAVEAVLQDAALTITGSVCMSVLRDSGISFSNVDQGTLYHHEGAIYRLMLDRT